MEKLKEELWETLLELKEEEFKEFKWLLNVGGIPWARLEKAKRQDTVDLMVQKYRDPGAREKANEILKKIDRNDLVKHLENSSSGPRGTVEGRQEIATSEKRQESLSAARGSDLKIIRLGAQTVSSRELVKLKWAQQFAVEVTLDPDTAHPHLILSDDAKQVHHGDVRQKLPYSPGRFKRCVNVVGKQSFSSEKSYFEVQVGGKTAWTVGVASESIDRKGDITLNPENGFWTLWLRRGDDYCANDEKRVHLSLHRHPKKVGVFVDYEAGLVSFYDVDAADHLYSFTGWSFTEKLYPYFSPCTNDGGTNSAPLIITPVNHPVNLQTPDSADQRIKEDNERKQAELMSVQQFAVEVTLDPDTAHPHLILSDDGTQVHHGDVRQKLPYSPRRFKTCVNVLGKQSFSSGRFYFEVQIKEKTAWTVGVASESIDRKGDITLSPENGFWTLWLRKGDDYCANDEKPVHLSLHRHPKKVGVFVDYKEGLVSFYDVDAADLLYSFTGWSFTEQLYPYFSPCTNNSGINSAPLIICPVKHNN